VYNNTGRPAWNACAYETRIRGGRNSVKLGVRLGDVKLLV